MRTARRFNSAFPARLTAARIFGSETSCRIFSGFWSLSGCLRRRSLMSASATMREGGMTLDLWLAAITAIGLLFYLVAVLLRPEKF